MPEWIDKIKYKITGYVKKGRQGNDKILREMDRYRVGENRNIGNSNASSTITERNGGGCGASTGTKSGGDGGSGVVIIRYVLN